VLGNLSLLGLSFFSGVTQDPIIAFIAEMGVLILLLQIGLETQLKDLVVVGPRALAVGVIGVVMPFALGTLVVGPWLLPGRDINAYLFLGATLSATSVGITGRVFRDMGKLDLPAARIVLGAAVIDDVLGLVILAVVSSLVTIGTVNASAVGLILAKALLFLGGSIGIGRLIAPWISNSLARLDAGPSMLFAQVLSTALAFSWLAHVMGLAPIIGAFAAGLLFEPVFLQKFERPTIVRDIEAVLPAELPAKPSASLSPGVSPTETNLITRINAVLAKHTGHQHENLIEPMGYFFVPVFFVLTGMQVDLQTLSDPAVLTVGLGVTAAAIIGKLMAGLAAGRAAGGWLVGWGMVPRGEVGLIFAMAGRQLGVMNEAMFSVIVIMVILTTLITPPVLSHLLKRQIQH